MSRCALFALALAACTTTSSTKAGPDAPAAAGSGSTAGVACDYHHDALNSSASVNTNSTVTWSCTSTTREMTSNDIPDHAVGAFPNANCPNTIHATTMTASLPLAPAQTGTTSRVMVVGYHLNGVKFDPGTAGTCDDSGTSCTLIGNTGNWNIEALGQSSFDFGVDTNHAHVQPTGEYHYHGMPEGSLPSGSHVTLVGFATDGFPIYARYGYATAMDASSSVRAMTSSYQVKATPNANRPSTSIYPMGTFTQDYEYVAGSGDLDECNGRTDVTPEFPQGIYHYYITDTYPFIQRCVKGTASATTGGGGGGGSGSGSGGGTPPTCAAGQTSMCCGDGVCDGPETHANCAADCP